MTTTHPAYVRTLDNLIDNERVTPTVTAFAEAALFPSTQDAATGAILTPLVATAASDVDAALAAADALYTSGAWSRLLCSPERDVVFERFASELETRHEDIRVAEMIDVGDRNAISNYGPSVLRDPSQLRSPSLKDEAKNVDVWTPLASGKGALKAVPLGPIVVLAPTNAPLGSSLIQILSAIYFGCPVLVKPSPYSPHAFNVFLDAVLAADLPRGLIQIVHGGAAVATQLIASPLTKGVCFTGSTRVGLAIAALCAPTLKPYALELGGVNPFVVLPGADVDAAVAGLLKTFSCINGQYCCGASNVLVHASLRDAFVEAFVRQASTFAIGDPRDETNTMGALNMCIATTLRATVAKLLELPETVAIAARAVKLPETGYYMAPMLLEGVDSSVQAELFGPVALLRTFQTISDVIAEANAAPARLKTYVYGKDGDETMERFIDAIECGWIDVNESEFENAATFDFSPLSGFGHADGAFFTRRVLRSAQPRV
ncbi:hypothetical protein SDRG_07068 [Saprolegnia diclina VS20]|uniref:Aldehyde dehydrogenase domain-containing protein n=1 Tax=Saprolegnia diclina (strain VS20) TaxID=1156394 RepID=T0QKW5_SAPDV|nr:hypothetical protein SDRG_07068 [Saprolegnia diclina VS20]EQC35356.1 hypothetical protein SDRG_07068 [Saprolegnia diclina VS20]|eukprot:XP_008611106.1 hypothetical protein SDRG_07068 [Saprolegnia diclina VS20]